MLCLIVVLVCAVVFVMFEEPTYTFTENGVTGSVVVVRTGITDEPFSVRVTGGKITLSVAIHTHTYTYIHTHTYI